MKVGCPLSWRTFLGADATCAEFTIAAPDGVLDHRSLAQVALPSETRGRERLGLILSGRGPIWLYAHLAHLAHPFAWVAVHDPRQGGAIVVARHTPDAPALGSVVPLPEADVPSAP